MVPQVSSRLVAIDERQFQTKLQSDRLQVRAGILWVCEELGYGGVEWADAEEEQNYPEPSVVRKARVQKDLCSKVSQSREEEDKELVEVRMKC